MNGKKTMNYNFEFSATNKANRIKNRGIAETLGAINEIN